MFKNYFTVALRNLHKNKIFSLINIFGLAAGLACCILILLFVRDEITYDHFHKNIDRIFRVKGVTFYSAKSRGYITAHPHIGPTLIDNFAEVEDFVRMQKEEFVLKQNNTLFKQKGMLVEQSFFNIFTIPLVSGNPELALKELQNIVIAKSIANKYFGAENPLGKTLSIKIKNQFQDFIVTGVAQDIPKNSSIQFDFLINLEKKYGSRLVEADPDLSIPTFILLNHQDAAQYLVAKFADTISKELQINNDKKSGYYLRSFKDYHLKREFDSNVLENGSKLLYTIILSGIALLILLIACFNFTNLSIGGASSRLKEIGMRKVLGAYQKQIAKQFLLESILQCFLALFFGLMLAQILLPAFNSFSMKSLSFDIFNGRLLFVLIGLCLVVGIIAGGYPSIILSRFSSVDLFRGKLKLSRKNVMSRILIVLQFSISIFLIVTTLFIHRQYNFMLDKELGYNSDQVIEISIKDFPESAKQNNSFYNIFKNKLLQYGSIKSIGASVGSLTEKCMLMITSTLAGERFIVEEKAVDHDYTTTLEMELVQGRNFSKYFPGDIQDAAIVNETFLKKLGIQSPLGRPLSECFEWDQPHKIIGVVKDFNTESLSKPIYPSFLCITPKYKQDLDHIFIKLDGNDIKQSIDTIEKEFKAMVPDVPFAFKFLDETLAKQYEMEKLWSQIITFASVLAILIACSGLFGLTLLIVVRRTKEIGIRKVLGASVLSIAQMINQDFIRLIAIANLIAWPVAYYIMNSYLQNYAFRIALSWWVFVLAGVFALGVAILTVSFYAVKAARVNPVNTLKYE